VVVLLLMIKGSHFGATPWDPYRNGLSTHPFGSKPCLISTSTIITMARSPLWPSASLTGGLLDKEACRRGVGPWYTGVFRASWRTLRGLDNVLLLLLVVEPDRREAASTDVQAFGLICLWEQDG